MILEQVKDTIKKYRLLRQEDKVVVGVSGGPDSVALLYLLHRLSKEFKLRLHIAHLDHKIRKDSYKDREFVEKLATKLNIPITVSQVEVKKIARSASLEEVARNARLGFLFQVARDTRADKIALGHSLDDQAETVLMRILRGTGLYGLAGIMPKRKIEKYTVIRPLLELRRRDIEKFLKQRRISSCRDQSNLEDIYFRNKVRNRLLPLLEKEYNSNIKEVLSNLSESAGYDYGYLNSVAEKIMRNWQGGVNLKKLLKLHPGIQRLILRLGIARVQGDLRRITFKHIKEIEDLILNRPVNSIVHLPKGISVIKRKNSLLFCRQ